MPRNPTDLISLFNLILHSTTPTHAIQSEQTDTITTTPKEEDRVASDPSSRREQDPAAATQTPPLPSAAIAFDNTTPGTTSTFTSATEAEMALAIRRMNTMSSKVLPMLVLLWTMYICTAFISPGLCAPPCDNQCNAIPFSPHQPRAFCNAFNSKRNENDNIHQLSAAASSSSTTKSKKTTKTTTEDVDEDVDAEIEEAETPTAADKNSAYVEGLLTNLHKLLDKYICNGSKVKRDQAINVLDLVSHHAKDPDCIRRAVRMTKRAGLPVESSFYDKYDEAAKQKELGKNDSKERKDQVAARKEWEKQRNSSPPSSPAVVLKTGDKSRVGKTISEGKSALSRRTSGGGKPDFMLDAVLGEKVARKPEELSKVATDKKELQDTMAKAEARDSDAEDAKDTDSEEVVTDDETESEAAMKVSGLVAKLGGGDAFTGANLGIGGLDDVLAQIKRRIWIPLAAPPLLLNQLGIHPVRGLLLYGKPGCGKTLLARSLGKLLSPMRPVTVVSGPEIMDRFVGSSEKNLRGIFDEPPDIYDTYRLGEADGGDAVARAALHVIVLDEFDAICRSRGGSKGKGDQGDAGVARDSVVNQMLAKMDGVHPLPVPTLVIGLTNKRSLIDSALLRPGRFEVQLEVPPPRSNDERVSILKVHTLGMFEAGRVLVKDASAGAATKLIKDNDDIPTYEELLRSLAPLCDGFSGASIAGVARAAASHALERVVTSFAENDGKMSTDSGMMDCVVTEQDFLFAIDDVKESVGDSDQFDDTNDDDSKEDGSNSYIDSNIDSTDIKDGCNNNNNDDDDGEGEGEGDNVVEPISILEDFADEPTKSNNLLPKTQHTKFHDNVAAVYRDRATNIDISR